MKNLSVGLDIAKLTFYAAVKINDAYHSKQFNNTDEGFTALLNWLDKLSVNVYHFCMESTGKYGRALALFLHENGKAVSIVNPARIKFYMKSQLTRNKTDKADAKSIRDYCELFSPATWQPVPEKIQILQSLVKRVDELEHIVRQERNRLEIVEECVRLSLDEHIEYMQDEIKKIEKKIDAAIEDDEDLSLDAELLLTIPGVGKKTINKTLAFLSHLDNFSHPKQLAAYIGLNHQHAQSGTSLNHSRLSKTGDPKLRAMLYMPALVSIKYNPNMKGFYEKLVAKGKPKKVAICAVMRKLVHIIYGVLKSKTPFDVDYVDGPK